MTCPTCQRHAGLLTAEEYEDKNGDCLSGDATLLSRDMMIERSRASVKESEARNGASAFENSGGRRRLHAVNSDRLVHEPSRAVATERLIPRGYNSIADAPASSRDKREAFIRSFGGSAVQDAMRAEYNRWGLASMTDDAIRRMASDMARKHRQSTAQAISTAAE